MIWRIDLETGKTRMIEAETINAARTIKLLIALLAMYPRKRVIHLLLDNAVYDSRHRQQTHFGRVAMCRNPAHAGAATEECACLHKSCAVR